MLNRCGRLLEKLNRDVHGVEEFLVGFCPGHALFEEFHGFQSGHLVEQFAENPDPVEFFFVHEQFFFARIALFDVDRRINALA